MEDFNIPLQVKLHGTRNLWTAIQNISLDFFILFSSFSGLAGTGGQSSYAAGNAFQSAFATAMSSDSIPSLAIDLGMVENAKIVNPLRERNIRRHGFAELNSLELKASMEYLMSSQGLQDNCRHLVCGCDYNSISQVDIPNATAKSPIFCHIQQPPEVPNPDTVQSVNRSMKVMFSEMSNMEDMQYQVVLALSQKISSLVASGILQEHPDASMTELGMDSLITVELRNWIMAESGAAIPIPEILDQASVESLATTILSRSPLIQERLKELTNAPDERNEDLIRDHDRKKSRDSGTDRSPSRRVDLPTLPLPDLTTTLKMYLDSRRCFLTSEGLGNTSNAIAEFLQTGGTGEQLQKRLESRDRDQTVDNWLTELYAKVIYLDRRSPINPTGIFYGGHILTEHNFTQAEKAAVLAVAALQFRASVASGTVREDNINDERVCLESLPWFFNAVREPGQATDIMRKAPGYDHIIVLRRGHIFKVQIGVGLSMNAFAKFKAAFERVLEYSEDRQLSLATLTADERSSWAQVSGQWETDRSILTILDSWRDYG